jgi:hypothetical protein
MSEPRRYLTDENAAPLARSILGSASDDGLDGTRVAALERALGVEAVATAEPPAARRFLARAPGASTVAALTTVAVAVALGWAGYFGSANTSEPPALATGSASTVAAPSLVEPAAPPVVTSAPEAVSVDLLPEAPPKPARAVPSAGARTLASSASASSATDDLAAEVRALERVRTAIAERRIAGAREALASYERAFPKKILEKEARVLEIEMLLAEGRRDEAELLATRFLASSADSPYAARVRSLLGASRRP